MTESGIQPVTKLSLADIVALPAPQAAPLLLGTTIVSHHDGKTVTGIITELEAYTQDDPASHTFRGPTKRNVAMFGPAGRAYVYFTYGMHYCMNIVCGPQGRGEAVLIRGIQITDGIETAIQRRYGDIQPTAMQLKNLSNGPGKAVQALGVSMADYGNDLLDPHGQLYIKDPQQLDFALIDQSVRVGISRGRDTPWRWRLLY